MATEKRRLVDANLIDKRLAADLESGDEKFHISWFRSWIGTQETVDAVEVVRCKACRFYQAAQSSLIGDVMCCTGQGDVLIQKEPNDFCSHGKRRTDV